MTNLIIQAARIADTLHCEQKRKYTNRPYIEHPGRVAARVMRETKSDEVVAAAWLHDVLEDCNVTYEELHRFHSIPLATCLLVNELTNASKDNLHKNKKRAERKQIDLERLRHASPEAKLIKLIDRIDNLRELDYTDAFASLYLFESKQLADALAGYYAHIDLELLDEIDKGHTALIKKEQPMVEVVEPAAQDDTAHKLAMWLIDRVGGLPDTLQHGTINDFTMYTDILPLMRMAGPAWKAAADRISIPKK